jgi:hypothetical protein
MDHGGVSHQHASGIDTRCNRFTTARAKKTAVSLTKTDTRTPCDATKRDCTIKIKLSKRAIDYRPQTFAHFAKI